MNESIWGDIMSRNEESILFAPEDEVHSLPKDTWKIMIVDDDEGVHEITKMVFKDFIFNNKGLEIISAYSGEQARKLISRYPDIAVILLDVVMEEDDSGLKVVEYIRNVLENKYVRVILRTGYPGQAPEKDVILKYDINDYKEKTELTATKLFTTLISALRGYKDIMVIEENRKALKKMIEASPKIFELQSMGDFISAVLSQMVSLMDLGKNAIYCNTRGFAATKYQNSNDFYVMAATGDFGDKINKNIFEFLDEEIVYRIKEAINTKKNISEGENYIVYFENKNQIENIIYAECSQNLKEFDYELMLLFCNNISIAFDNIYLNKEIEDTQKEIIYTLGEVTEARSEGMGNHVKRVSKYCELLSKKYGLSEEEVQIIKMAAPIHDIGKVAIPDNILHKPGKLTSEEFEIMKTHSALGYNMLKNSNRRVLKAASIIAHQHHEKYDGTGYPQGLKGEDIHIYGRISCIADVFDALGSKRVYKDPWPLEKILDYFKEESGHLFDPKLIKIFFENIEEIISIRDKFTDEERK